MRIFSVCERSSRLLNWDQKEYRVSVGEITANSNLDLPVFFFLKWQWLADSDIFDKCQLMIDQNLAQHQGPHSKEVFGRGTNSANQEFETCISLFSTCVPPNWPPFPPNLINRDRFATTYNVVRKSRLSGVHSRIC